MDQHAAVGGGDFHLRPFAGEADYAAMAAVGVARPGEDAMSVGFLRRRDRERDRSRPVLRSLAELAGRVVGFAETGYLYNTPESRCAQLDLRVHPDFRRRGIGGALFVRACEELAPLAPRLVEAAARERSPAGIRFLERRGFRLAQRNPLSELDPSTFDPAFPAAPPAGIELRSLGELMRDDPEWRVKLYELQCAVERDVPWYGEVHVRPFDEWAASYADNPDLLPDAHLVALDGDAYVGLTQLWASEADERVIYTGLTGVRRSHRRRGIASALKARAIRHAAGFRTAAGEVPVIRTGNEESNPMLALNRRLGFREVDALNVYVREMAPD